MSGSSLAATGATKDEAVAMVKKAVARVQAEGPDKAYAEISNPAGPFVDRDLYIVVYGLDGMVLAHGANANRIGTNQIADKDPDGKAFVKERVELAATHPSFWQTYKFMNPVTHKVEPKDDVLRAARPDGGVRRGLSALRRRTRGPEAAPDLPRVAMLRATRRRGAHSRES